MSDCPQQPALVMRPEGGSLNTIALQGSTIVKSYDGPLRRGYTKLRREYNWLCELPESAARHFARPVFYQDRADPPLVELHLGYEADKESIAKGVLRGLWPVARTADAVGLALRVVLDDVYPGNTAPISALDTWQRFHRARLSHALGALRMIPSLADFLNAESVIINGLCCPGFDLIAQFLDQHAGRYFTACTAVRFHGDLHLDNILTTPRGPLRVVLVDPRGGDGPPHYDLAKMFKATTAAYDSIHYGRYSQTHGGSPERPSVELTTDRAQDLHYAAAHRELLRYLPRFAEAEGIRTDSFARAMVVAAYVHVVSFCWYHANHPAGCDVERVLAFLATAALMGRGIKAAGPDEIPPIAETRLLGL